MLLCYTTFSERDNARDAARELLDDRLVACANITEIDSLYRWNDEIVEDDEHLMLCKTTDEKRETVQERLAAIHPYDEPAIVFYKAADVSDGYASWVRSVTGR